MYVPGLSSQDSKTREDLQRPGGGGIPEFLWGEEVSKLLDDARDCQPIMSQRYVLETGSHPFSESGPFHPMLYTKVNCLGADRKRGCNAAADGCDNGMATPDP